MSITINNLNYKVNNTYIIKDLSVEFDSNSISVLTGENGIGKTVFFKLLANILTPTSGEIKHDLNRPILVFQKPILLNRSVIKNMLHLGKILKIVNYRGKTENILKQLNLWDSKDKNALLLSGGQAMKLQLARMILSEKNFWLLDEPFSSLDDKSTETIKQIIIKNSKHKKIMIIDHNKNLILENCKYYKMTKKPTGETAITEIKK